jgi:type II secretion system protein N
MRQLLARLRELVTRQNVLLYGGYTAFFVFCFVLFAYWTFPYERVRDLLVAEASSSALPGGAQNKLSIGELGPHWLTGVAMSAISFEKRAAPGSDEPASKVQIDELTLHASPLSLLLGGIDVSFAAEVGEGELEGNYAGDEDEPTEVVAQLDAVDLERLGVGSYLGVPIAGSATGNVDVTLAKEAAGTQGSLELRIEGLRFGDTEKLKIKVPGMGGALTLAKADAGTLELKVAVRDGVATIETMEAKGKDLEMSGSGSIRIASPFAQSRADITLAVKISDAYKNRDERTKMALELMSNNPTVQRATGPDGTMRFKLTGAMTALRYAPAGTAVRSPGKAREKKPRAKPAPAEGE